MISMFYIPIIVSVITLFLYAEIMPLYVLIPQVIVTAVLIICMVITEVYYAKKERIQEKRVALLESQVEHLTEAVGLLSSTVIKDHLDADKEKY